MVLSVADTRRTKSIISAQPCLAISYVFAVACQGTVRELRFPELRNLSCLIQLPTDALHG